MVQTFQQFNPSTLKALHDNDTKKAIVIHCCRDSGIFTVTFSGVNECSGYDWPSDLNTSFELNYVLSNPSYHRFYNRYPPPFLDDWYIQLDCYFSGSPNYIHLTATYYQDGTNLENAFYNITALCKTEQCDNQRLLVNCGDTTAYGEISGYGGQATYIWTPS